GQNEVPEKTAAAPSDVRRVKKKKSRSKLFSKSRADTPVKTALERSEANKKSRSSRPQKTGEEKSLMKTRTEERSVMKTRTVEEKRQPPPQFKLPSNMEPVEPTSKLKTIAVLSAEKAESFHAKVKPETKNKLFNLLSQKLVAPQARAR
ncbi:hypothetical protein COOONC_16837, partial [Cooperia oncophora]